MSYFSVERNGSCYDHIMIVDNNKNAVFEHYLNMDYDTMKSQEDLDDFVVAIMEASNSDIKGKDDQTIVTLIGEDDIFIWSIIMGSGENDEIRYSLVDWKKDGHMYRYKPENNA